MIKIIKRLAQIAHEHDKNGRFIQADAVTDAMIRLSQSATENVWNGVKQVGTGLKDDVQSVGTALEAPWNAAGAAASAAWNSGIKSAPAAAEQSWDQSDSRFNQQAGQALSNVEQGGEKAAGPYGLGLPGAAAQDAVHSLDSAARNYVGGIMSDRQRSTQQWGWLTQAMQAHAQNGTGWQVLDQIIRANHLSPSDANSLKQQFGFYSTERTSAA